MPKVTVSVPHNSGDPQEIIAKSKPAIEKTVKDFEGHNLEIEWADTSADFTFKSLGFNIKGRLFADEENVTVEVDLPIAALIFKDRVQKAVTKNLTRSLEAKPEQPDATGGG